MDAFLNHWATTTFMTIVTIYALFGDDIRLLSFEKVWSFYSITVVL